MSFNLATILRESARTAPDKPVLHVGNRSLTYAQVYVLEDLPKGSTGKILKSELRGLERPWNG